MKNWLLADPAHTKGEFVLVIPPRPERAAQENHEELLTILLEELPLKQAVTLACKLTKASKNELYDLALQIKN